jgi:hypothetical protein
MQLDQETDPNQQHDEWNDEVNVGNNGFGSLLQTHLTRHTAGVIDDAHRPTL